MYIEGQILFVFALPMWVIIRLVLLLVKKRRGQVIRTDRELMLWAFFFYIICVLSITIFPLNILIGKGRSWVSINLIPVVGTVKELAAINDLHHMQNFMIRFWIKNTFGNMALLMPMGVFLPAMWSRYSRVSRMVFFSFCFSLSIETIQLLSGYLGNVGRAFDVDDLLLNILGAWIGAVLYHKLFKNIIYKLKEDKQAA